MPDLITYEHAQPLIYFVDFNTIPVQNSKNVQLSWQCNNTHILFFDQKEVTNSCKYRWKICYEHHKDKNYQMTRKSLVLHKLLFMHLKDRHKVEPIKYWVNNITIISRFFFYLRPSHLLSEQTYCPIQINLMSSSTTQPKYQLSKIKSPLWLIVINLVFLFNWALQCWNF